MICFYFNFHQEEKRLADRLVKQIQFFYPDSDILCITDDESNPSWTGVKTICGNHLKKRGKIRLFIRRNFQKCIQNSQAAIFIQVDPDTYIWRHFHAIPSAHWFGDTTYQVQSEPGLGNNFNVVMGYCVGFSRHLMVELLSSNIINDSFVEGKRIYKPLFSKNYTPSEDVAIGYMLTSLGFTPSTWAEVYEDRQTNICKQIRKPYKYAVTHPVKTARTFNSPL